MNKRPNSLSSTAPIKAWKPSSQFLAVYGGLLAAVSILVDLTGLSMPSSTNTAIIIISVAWARHTINQEFKRPPSRSEFAKLYAMMAVINFLIQEGAILIFLPQNRHHISHLLPATLISLGQSLIILIGLLPVQRPASAKPAISNGAAACDDIIQRPSA